MEITKTDKEIKVVVLDGKKRGSKSRFRMKIDEWNVDYDFSLN